MLRYALLVCVATSTPGIASAEGGGGPATGTPVPVPVYVYPTWGFGMYRDCAFYGTCLDAYRAARSYEERREQVRRQRQEIATPTPAPDLWSGDGPWGYTRRMPPPTPESEIQPQYRESGQVLPQYRRGESSH